jgi:hypothetical protein
LGSQSTFQGITDVPIIVYNYNRLLGGIHSAILFGGWSALARLLQNRLGTLFFRADLIGNFTKRVLFQLAKNLSACARD